jgi:hypothetical protein
VKDKQWSIGGPQHEKIKTFMRKLDRGEIPAFRVSTVGKIAEVLLAVPFADKLHDVLGSDDTTFLMVVFIVLFTIFVIALACRPDNSDPSEQQQQRERQSGVRRRRDKAEKEE